MPSTETINTLDSSRGFSGLARLSSILVGFGLVGLLTLWVTLKPPFQVPDEFAHYLKALSTSTHPWLPPSGPLTIEEGRITPLAGTPMIHGMCFHPDRSLRGRDIIALQSTGWVHQPGSALVDRESTAASYPSLTYHLLRVPAEWINEQLSPGAFGAFFSYRFVALGYSLLLWGWVAALVARTVEFRGRYLLAVGSILVMPMMSFMASGINPDLFVIPLSAAAILIATRLLKGESSVRVALGFTALLLALVLMKPTANAIPSAIASAAIVLGLFRCVSWGTVAKLCGACGVALILGWLLFYRYSPTVIIEVPGAITVWDYPSYIPLRLLQLSRQYMGVLGWLDTMLPDWWYILLASTIALCAASAPWRELSREPGTLLILLAALAFISAHILLEWATVERFSTALQGRYFLPVGIAMALLICRARRLPQILFCLALGAFQIAMIERALDRYYDGSVERMLKMVL